MPNPSPTRPADPARAARLDERLALYAQYASLVGEEVAAAWSADPAHAGPLTREIAATRADVAERYAALRAAPAGAPAGAFGELYADAVTELDHQRAVDQALRDRLEAARFGAALLLPAGEPVDPPSDDSTDDSPPDAEPATDADGMAPLGGALVAARSTGIGGALGGQFPGIVAGADPAVYAAQPSDAPVAPSRLDVRF